MKRLLITANSPGEMAGWVVPILKEWHARALGPADILLLPCSFATGEEERVARSLPGVERVYRPSDYLKLWWSQGRDYSNGNLLHLGGDLMYSALLSWRWKIRSWSYLWARPWWDSAFTGYFTKDEWGVNWLLKRKVTRPKIHLTGDLVLDAVRQHVPHRPPREPAQISYLPGSRSHEVAALAPLFLEVHRRLRQSHPDLKGVLHLSPFLPQERLVTLLESSPDSKVGGIQGTVVQNSLRAEGVELQLATSEHYPLLARSTLAVSIPGTKTAEAGYLRTPVLTIVPLNRPEHLPSIGLVGLLDFLPGGSTLKGRLMLRLKPNLGLLAHPNILAQQPLLPEIVEVMTVELLANAIETELGQKEKLREVSESLEKLYPWDSHPAAALVARMAAPTASNHPHR